MERSLGLRNLVRTPTRTGLTIFALAVTLTATMLLETALHSWLRATDMSSRGYLITRSRVSIMARIPVRYADLVQGIPGVASVTHATAVNGIEPGRPETAIDVMAVDSSSFVETTRGLIQVSPAAVAAWQKDRQGTLVGEPLAAAFGWKPGDKVFLDLGAVDGTDEPVELHVSGLFKTIDRSFDASAVCYHFSYTNDRASDTQKDVAHVLLVRLKPGEAPERVAREIDRRFANTEIQTLSTDLQSFNKTFLGAAMAIFDALGYAAIALGALSIALVGNALGMSIRERTREYAVLRAIGFPRAFVARVIGWECLFLCLAALVLSLVLSFGLVRLLVGPWLSSGYAMYFPPLAFSPREALEGTILALVAALVVAALGTTAVLRRGVIQGLRSLD